jgi:hypothetical protein
MKIGTAREAARQWMMDEAHHVPGFRAAYLAGSTNWLADDAELDAASDVDIIVTVDDRGKAGARQKFIHSGALLEVSCLHSHQLQSPEQILGDYHVAPSFCTTKLLHDPSGALGPIHAAVVRDYAKRNWVRRRCDDARGNVLRHLRAADATAPLHDQAMAILFAAGITTHVLLVAGLRNPTVRTRYAAARELLQEYGCADFHERLLELLGAARFTRERAGAHAAALAEMFDAAKETMRSPFPFACDISEIARPAAIDASWQRIASGEHREAIFWIGVTHSRCQKILAGDAPEKMSPRFQESYRHLLSDLRMSSPAEIAQRRAEIERMLPRVADVAEKIIAANRAIESD